MIKALGKRILRSLGLAPRRVTVSRRVGPWEEFTSNVRYQRAFIRHRKRDIPQLNALKNVHAGRDQCVIMGNGPSLNLLDLTLLKDEITFGFNAIWLNEKKMGFVPTYYSVADLLVAEDRHAQINAYKGSKIRFFPLERANLIRASEDVIFLWQLEADPYPQFATDVTLGIYGGDTVTYHALQLAYHMGFRTAILIGMDHDFEVAADIERVAARHGSDELTSVSADANHFHPDYFGSGYRWHDPRIDLMEAAFEKAREVWEFDGRRILNATPGGKLEVFDRIDYATHFNSKAAE